MSHFPPLPRNRKGGILQNRRQHHLMQTTPKPLSARPVVWLILQPEILLVLVISIYLFPIQGKAQFQVDQAELQRLRHKSVEALSEGDHQGAALTIGKAALLANFMAQQETQLVPRAHFQSLAALLRSKENVYRAFALFQQSGEHIPASLGVCGTISLASADQKRAQFLFPEPLSENPLLSDLPNEIMEWKEIIEELQIEFECLEPARPTE